MRPDIEKPSALATAANNNCNARDSLPLQDVQASRIRRRWDLSLSAALIGAPFALPRRGRKRGYAGRLAMSLDRSVRSFGIAGSIPSLLPNPEHE
jgi:hypothetical protein